MKAKTDNYFRRTLQDMHDLAKRRGFEFLSDHYINCETKYLWKCPNGHSWWAKSSNIKSGKGCPHCRISIKENQCRFVFEQLTGKKFPNNWKVLENGQELDGYCQELNLAFEYNGQQHYKIATHWQTDADFAGQIERDHIKRKLCRKLKIRLIVIPYYFAENHSSIEKYVKKRLPKLKVEMVVKKVDWTKYKKTDNRLKNIIALCQKKNITCLTRFYPGHHNKVNLKCNVCNYLWATRVSVIKKGRGCPKCGHKISWAKRRLKRSKDDVVWDKNYEQLKEYFEINKKYPSHHDENLERRQLGGWIFLVYFKIFF